MKVSVLTWCAGVSGALLIALVVMYSSYADSDPRLPRIRLGSKINVSFSSRWGGRIVIFNDSHAGPYLGSLVGVAGSAGAGRSLTGCGDSCGVYFRSLSDPNGAAWTLALSMAYPVVALGIAPVLLLWKRSRQRPPPPPTPNTKVKGNQ
jgi:hypothetical protein